MFEAEEVKRNKVSAKSQVTKSSLLRIYEKETAKLKIVFAGNSITCHAPAPEIGWHGYWGMAASCEEKDYVHQTVQILKKRYSNISFAVAQLARWELICDEAGEQWKEAYRGLKSFEADVAVIRMGENIPAGKLNAMDIKEHIENMIAFFGNGCRQIIVTDCFWKRDKLDAILKELCEDKEYTFCKISDIYENPKSMALNQYENESVANHPSDYGMRKIAERIAESIME